MGGTDRLLEGEDTARGGTPGVLDSGSNTMLYGRGDLVSPSELPRVGYGIGGRSYAGDVPFELGRSVVFRRDI